MASESMGQWDKWVNSAEGKRATDWESLAATEYLENRLWRAFTAGMAAQRDADKKAPR